MTIIRAEGSTMREPRAAKAFEPRWIIGVILMIAMLSVAWGQPATGAVTQRRFPSIEDAAKALLDSIKTGNRKEMLAILGEDGKGIVWSGDEVSDRRGRERFVTAWDEQHHFEAGDGKVVMVLGRDNFPFPIPIVPDGPSWRFDTAAGKEEILNRRIGRNEFNTIQTCLAYADAQREYYARDPDRNGLLQYAQKFASTPGKRDGLYWPTKPGEAPSPLGPLVARARGEGYSKKSSAPVAYWGYYYRILTAQGKDAPGGAYDYLAHGRMIGGFAMVAFPAEYGVSGVMTFVVNQDGVVYQKDLGPQTESIGRAMKQFNPDSTWEKVKV
jgi:Protein of unknown function (DUF2950)